MDASKRVEASIKVISNIFSSGEYGDMKDSSDVAQYKELQKKIAQGVRQTDFKAKYGHMMVKKGCIPVAWLISNVSTYAAFNKDRRGATRAVRDTLREIEAFGDIKIVKTFGSLCQDGAVWSDSMTEVICILNRERYETLI